MKQLTHILRLIFFLLLIVILSFGGIHFLAFFGIFIAFFYPIWCLIAPKKSLCLVCRLGKEGDECILCRRKITKEQGISPANFSSAICNGLIILFFSVLSIGIVFVESNILSSLGFSPAAKTISFVLPPKGQYKLGEIFPMEIALTGIKEPINAIQTDVQFDQEKLEVVNISFENSVANIFIEKEIHNDTGWFRIVGGLPNPGYRGSEGHFATVYFLTKTPGPTEVIFLPSSMVLANDGKGTNVVKDFATKSYLILPEKVGRPMAVPTQAVSGIDTAKTQLTLYDTDIVYSNSSSEKPRASEKKLWEKPLELLASFDEQLVSFYQLFDPITK